MSKTVKEIQELIEQSKNRKYMNKTDGHIEMYQKLAERNKTDQAKLEKTQWAQRMKEKDPSFFSSRVENLNSEEAWKKKRKKWSQRKNNQEYLRKQSIAQKKRFGIYVDEDED